MDILEEIVAHKRMEVAALKEQTPARQLYKHVETMMETPVPSMRSALLASETGIIAEFKRRSPSKGWIKENGSSRVIPLSYQSNGAAAISVLTDKQYFGGNDNDIKEAQNSGVTIPILYKNFVVDEYQLFQARLCGASAVLLIAADLRYDECRSLMRTAHEIGLEVLMEMHGESELRYCDLEPDICGINNRNLGTFVTATANSLRLAHMLPDNACKISESGISSPKAIKELRQAGYDGFLIGEAFMRTADPGATLHSFIDAIRLCS